LPKLGRAAGDADLIADVQLPIRQMDDGDADPVEVVDHDPDPFLHDNHPLPRSRG
jgi:hypothetical protein